ncbi:MAG: ABC transporter substrate-binding protein [Actinomycetota bacterium]|nr:ABC transporter substrate-binding protein [Actinomycetota bacterium]
MRRRLPLLTLLVLLAVVLAGCGSSSSSSSSAVSQTGAAAGSPTSSAAACTPGALATQSQGVLTVATDSPAYPPYFVNNNPTNGKGFESAVAYAVAAKLGYPAAKVRWTKEPFDASYAPGPKSFDFDINEISITPARSHVVDFSAPYYTNPQGVIVPSGSPLAHTTTLAALRNANIGVQIGTTSLSAVTELIKPLGQPQVFNTSNDVVSAFKIHRINALVTDLATAFQLTATSLPHTTIAGQFSAPGGDRWGLLLSKGSKLTPCVSHAVSALSSDGTLARLSHRWIASAASAAVLH